jgi:hypothetical protein
MLLGGGGEGGRGGGDGQRTSFYLHDKGEGVDAHLIMENMVGGNASCSI